MEDLNNLEHSKLLIQRMLRPFTYRQSDILPSYNAAQHLESYFPVHFPYGRGGPSTTNIPLGNWVKHALSVHGSRFCNDKDFFLCTCSQQACPIERSLHKLSTP